ncbi:hypothetical protein [Caulobacter sp. RHG1]|uniref:hypothetical protein n=1 Tax=Caulobacter sp. (strain RHG1) TaxID=2545762 RepID=UPI001553235A|nr:hypothetical protein [Caulobacter sp. RHG1]NQE61400.1 hypothetical protein [Caulobacter sp. RHG1]
MTDRTRFLDHKAFGALLADLRLTPNVSQDRLLEFLERVGLVAPIARIDWPRALVVEGRGGVASPPATPTERSESQALSDALDGWRRRDADPAAPHPLDMDPTSPGGTLITRTFSPETFRPWTRFDTEIVGVRAKPFSVPDAVDTYYHDWQALLVADALETGMRLVFDTRDPQLLALAMDGDLAALPQDRIYQHVSFEGPRGLRDGMTWAGYFDAAAQLEVARSRKVLQLAQRQDGPAFRLNDAEMQELADLEAARAVAALAALEAPRSQVMAFIVYLCERWDEKRRRGQGEIAAEYKRQIELAARLAMSAYGVGIADLSVEVGRVTGHFANTLDVIFPDWSHSARQRAELSLKASVVAQAPLASPELILTDADVGDLLDWLERDGQWRVHLGIEAMLKHQFTGDPVDHAALAKEVETLATTLEHLINALLREAGCDDKGTLMKKLARYWGAVADVGAILRDRYDLVTLKRPLSDQLAMIAELPATGPNLSVAQTLLRAVLYRNAGQHTGMASFTEEALHEAARAMLTAMLLCRKALRVAPPQP